MVGEISVEQIGNVFADAVERVSVGLVAVHARMRLPATGTVWPTAAGGFVIVTASHAVEREDRIAVTLDDDQTVEAVLLGRDITRDLAVLRISHDVLSPVELAISEPRVGTLAMAVGRPYMPATQASLGAVVFVGSVRFRRFQTGKMIHADPTLYPGFSGGPLIGSTGAVYGINTSGVAQIGGITIPTARVSRIVDDIVSYGYVQTAWIGVTVQQVPLDDAERGAELGETAGLMVQSVHPDAPASIAGIQIGDILVSMDGQSLEDVTDLQHALCHENIGGVVHVRAMRAGVSFEAVVTTAARPEHP